MFKRRATPTPRRPPATATSTATDAPGPPGPTGDRSRGTLVERLATEGWALPHLLASDRRPSWTLVGTVASPLATPVDPAGLVSADGWALDWWIGADDRWHRPAVEAAVRQQLVDDAPVVETLVKIPGGDAVHRAYGFRSPRRAGDEWVGVEVENRTPVPFAVALVVRPFVVDGVGSVGEITVEAVEGGRGRDVAHLVRVDGRPALVLPRRPARVAAGNRAAGDVLDEVTSGRAGTELVTASCPEGLATLALVFPLAHTATLRAVLPVGGAGADSPVDADEPVGWPSVLPDAATVAAGWEIHRRGPRVVVPDRRLAATFERARAHLQLAHDGEVVRRDGATAADLEPGATELVLGALDALDRPADVGAVVARWPDRLAALGPAADDAVVLTVVARHWALHRGDALVDWMLPEVAAAVERLDRRDRRGRLADPRARVRAVDGLRAAARLLAGTGQGRAGDAVARLAERVAAGAPGPGPDDAGSGAGPAARLEAAARALAAGRPEGFDLLAVVMAEASPTATFRGPGPGGRALGHDLAADAALVLAVRALLVADHGDDLRLLPVFPLGWYGAGVEVHDLPTAHGRLSYAVRWHGTRPALLWELEPHAAAVEGAAAPEAPVVLRAPGLDSSWSTAEPRGEALLAEVAPPEGLDTLRLVADHPDIDPAMRRPADTPAPPGSPLPEGGSFS